METNITTPIQVGDYIFSWRVYQLRISQSSYVENNIYDLIFFIDIFVF